MVIRLGMMQHTITGWLPQLYYVHSIRLDISHTLYFVADLVPRHLESSL